MNLAERQALIEEKIKTGGRRTTAQLLRDVLSVLNYVADDDPLIGGGGGSGDLKADGSVPMTNNLLFSSNKGIDANVSGDYLLIGENNAAQVNIVPTVGILGDLFLGNSSTLFLGNGLIDAPLGNLLMSDSQVRIFKGGDQTTGFTFSGAAISVGQIRMVSIPDESGTVQFKKLTTKGDLLAFATADTRLGVGTDGYVLTADSSQPTGLKWAAGARYTLNAETAQFNPADATTYYAGVIVSSVSMTDGDVAMVVPYSGTVKRIDIVFTNQGTPKGSNETSSAWFRLTPTIGSATDTLISSSITTNATRSAFTNSGLSVSVTAGDVFEIKWTAPTYATNPTNVRYSVIIYIE